MSNIAVNEIKKQLARQISFIKTSCEHYDRGEVGEAVRIAVALRVIFHNTSTSTSLLRHLNAHGTRLLSTAAPFVPDPLMPNLFLVEAVFKASAAGNGVDAHCICEPLLDTSPRNDFVHFADWWKGESVIEHKQPPTRITRRELVLAAANKDGGAHYDTARDVVYDLAAAGSGIKLEVSYRPEFKQAPQILPYENIHFGSLRQMAYEVLHSPDVLNLARQR